MVWVSFVRKREPRKEQHSKTGLWIRRKNPTNFIQTAKTFIIACLEVLAWLGPTAHIAERKRYFSSISSSNSGLFSDEEVRTHAIGNLPLLLARIGFDHVNEFTDQLG